MASEVHPHARRVASTDEMSRQEWLKFRAAGIGGSDAAAILGLSKWSSPVDIWESKVNAEAASEDGASEAMEWGTRLEALIRARFKELHPDWIVRQVHAILENEERPFMRANLDGVVNHPDHGRGILEIKTASSRTAADWKDGVPAYYAPQADHYMAVTGLPFVVFAVLIGGSEYREEWFFRDEARITALVEAETEFWAMVQDRRIPRASGKADLEVIRRYLPLDAAAVVDAPEDAFRALANAARDLKNAEEAAAPFVQAVKDAEARRDACRAALIQEAGNPGAIRWEGKEVFRQSEYVRRSGPTIGDLEKMGRADLIVAKTYVKETWKD